VKQACEVKESVLAEPVVKRYRGLICDLDGVVYRGSSPVPGAVECLNALMSDRMGVVFATNNASRSPAAAADHLRELGLRDKGWSVVTSAQAAAAHLADRFAEGTRVLAVGGPGVAQALTEVGLKPVHVSQSRRGEVAAVVQGAGQDVTWRDLAEVGYLVQQGLPWVATNLDPTIPTSRGLAPGNGALVTAVQTTTTAAPHVTGKPESALFDLARLRLETAPRETLVCGDRLETDIKGANAAGLDSMVVLSGACSLKDLVFAAPHNRPTYVAPDLSGLLEPGIHPVPEAAPEVQVEADGSLSLPPYIAAPAALRAVVSTAWAVLDVRGYLSADADVWLRLAKRLGLGPS